MIPEKSQRFLPMIVMLLASIANIGCKDDKESRALNEANSCKDIWEVGESKNVPACEYGDAGCLYCGDTSILVFEDSLKRCRAGITIRLKQQHILEQLRSKEEYPTVKSILLQMHSDKIADSSEIEVRAEGKDTLLSAWKYLTNTECGKY